MDSSPSWCIRRSRQTYGFGQEISDCDVARTRIDVVVEGVGSRLVTRVFTRQNRGLTGGYTAARLDIFSLTYQCVTSI
jgi:hypothetical protein